MAIKNNLFWDILAQVINLKCVINPMHSGRYQIFRDMVVQARKESGFTQVQIAEILGKPQSYISKIERGERRLDFTEFIDFANIIELDIAKFIQGYQKQAKRVVCHNPLKFWKLVHS